MESHPIFRIYMILSIILTTILNSADSKWVKGTIRTDSDWVFITRFCFLSRVGDMNYHLEYPVGYGVENMVFYYDVPGQWSAVYQTDLTCQEKVAVLQGRNQFPLSNDISQCAITKREGQDWFICDGHMDFSTARERWWFVVLTRCGNPKNMTYKGMYLDYKLHMTNGDDWLHQEFSADEFYILVIDIVFFILYIILLVVAVVCAIVLRQRQLFHTTYKMYLAAISTWTIHLLFMVIAWGYYGTTGWEIRPLEVTGRILQTFSNIIFILMLVLLAKGYTVVRGRLTSKAVLKITIFINLYLVAMVVMFIWEGVLFDPGLVLYYYESPPGYGMVTVILIGWLWFTKAAVFTMKHFSSKTVFYISFYTFYTIWFWASPFVVLIAMFAMAKWTREKTVNGVQQFIAFLAHLIFLILTLPHKANDNFPFHIRTTQIGIIDDEKSSQKETGHYGFTGDSFTGVGPNLDIFITSKAVRPDNDGGQDQLYIPLESSPVGSSSSIPSRFEQIVIPPMGRQLQEDRNQNRSTNLGVSDEGSLQGQSRNQDLPLQQAVAGDSKRREVSLPPIRGSGLPPLVASTHPNLDSHNIPNHAAMFQVK